MTIAGQISSPVHSVEMLGENAEQNSVSRHSHPSGGGTPTAPVEVPAWPLEVEAASAVVPASDVVGLEAVPPWLPSSPALFTVGPQPTKNEITQPYRRTVG